MTRNTILGQSSTEALKRKINRGAPNVDDTVEIIVGAADRLLRAGVATNADYTNGGAINADECCKIADDNV